MKGSGVGDMHGQARRVAAAARWSGRGAMLADMVEATRACVDQTGHAGRAGEVTITIELSTAGRVTRVELDEDSFDDDAALRRCLTARIARWRFVVHASLRPATVTFSVRFG